MSTICITGSASGIGAATRALLESQGHQVVGVDLHHAEVVADLTTTDGRRAMIDGVADACGGTLDGVVAGAGVQSADPPTVVSLNFFGAVATLDGLRPLLAASTVGAAVAISSNSATTMAGVDDDAVTACLAGDEEGARARLAAAGELAAYPSSKLALARWVRRHSVTADWIGAGIRLNAVAPGPTLTPMTEAIRDWVLDLGDTYPVPAQRLAEPAEIASVIAFLLGSGATYVVGAFLPVDGGGDAAVRGDHWPDARH
jgi:NAD(P)-dependent dehydrogenase (short-subunit alcohol dehydrogenase family)